MKTELELAYVVMQKASGIKVRDKVRVLRRAESYEMGWGNFWCDGCEASIEKTLTVQRISDGDINLDTSAVANASTGQGFPFFVLEVVEPAKPEKMITVCGKEYSEATLEKAMQEYVKGE